MSHFYADSESLHFLTEEEIDAPRAAMQAATADIGLKAFLRRIYHQAPDDVFEKIISLCIARGLQGESFFRFVSKRLMSIVRGLEVNARKLEYAGPMENGPSSIPHGINERCRKIEEIRCNSLRSLEGCPDGLKRLWIGNARHLSDLSPLASCTMMEILEILDSNINDISAVASMPLLKVFVLQNRGRPSIKDISPLSSCTMLKSLSLFGQRHIMDISRLSGCTSLEHLDLTTCYSITRFTPLPFLRTLKTLKLCGCLSFDDQGVASLSSCTSLEKLDISQCEQISSLAPLSALTSLVELNCHDIGRRISALPLASCTSLRTIFCNREDPDEEDEDLVDLEELKIRLPQLKISSIIELDSDDEISDDDEISYGLD